MSSQEGKKSLLLPEEVLNRIDRRVSRTEFDSTEAYVTYVLEEIIAHIDSVGDGDFDAVDEAEVKDRLASLGYLNE